MFEKEAKERAKDFTDNKERQAAYECGFLDGADRMRGEMQKQGLALQSDMDKTIYQNIALRKKIEKIRKLEEDNADLKQSLDWANERESEDCKRIAELEEQISVLLSCKNCPENKGGFICKKEYENKCLAQKIQYIKELEQEKCELLGIIQGKDKTIKDLKEDNKVMSDNYSKMEQKFYDNLTQAKELLARWVSDKTYTVSEQKDLISDTEQFLKEV